MTPTEVLEKMKVELEAAEPHLEEAAKLAEKLWEDLARPEVQDGGARARGMLEECDRLIKSLDEFLEV
jgi:hypothetical protein